MKYLKYLWCKWFGHNFSIYHAGCTYNDPVGEMAGYCERCHFDTHGESTAQGGMENDWDGE